MEIKLVKGDITKISVDAIVNAANSSLMGGGGVDGAIHRAGGKIIHDECMKIVEKQGGCPTGEAVYTSAGNLPAKFVIHTVGPIWYGGKRNEEDLLKSCYINSLKLAENLNLKTISFPNISTGVYHFPKEKAAKIAIDSVKSFSSKNIETVYFVCFDEENYQIYLKMLS
ncbi:MAG: O-acetyl-ADP-ribose deacetylase [Ignavibacteriales bacterium]|uniref:O-acetyl-ADP-ribose deacetylase n=1 Tax=Stygiobacter electus TaxID=3032292 RepID=A0AAE3TBB9_9BACT|nr:O-acetyl-ADP-ribose deacetylase [Stygiobacter electus]MBI5807702.1 O-acetyl-ADP-ribose deacetylase [Ignavibacteriales bacterium]MDF1610650.1 O-acetyl-ADP-ribose deacetylase [Stygiobacter electus]